MVDEVEDLSEEVVVAEANPPGEAVCLTINTCIKAAAEVQTITMIVVTIMAKVEDRQPTTTTITTIQLSAGLIETMKVLVSATIIQPMKVEDHHRNGD
jgi:hypothetical protein